MNCWRRKEVKHVDLHTVHWLLGVLKLLFPLAWHVSVATVHQPVHQPAVLLAAMASVS